MERTAAPSPLLEEPDGRRANLQICYSCLVQYQSPALLTGSVGVVEENMEKMGRMTKASSSDSEMESRTAPNCVNCLEPEGGMTHCGLVTMALVSREGSNLERGDEKENDQWSSGSEVGISWPGLGRTDGMSPLDTEFELGDTSVGTDDDIDEQIFNLDSEGVGREVYGEEASEVGEVGDHDQPLQPAGDAVRGRERSWLVEIPLPRLLLCGRNKLGGGEKRGNKSNAHCDFHDVRYHSYQPRPYSVCLKCATKQPRRVGIGTREQESTRGIDMAEQKSTREPLTVVRGLTHSLLDLPTFLSSAPVLLGSVHSIPPPTTSAPSPPRYACLSDRLKDYQLPSNSKHATNARRSQWTIMCVAFAFFCTCLGLVGTMLSVTSDYQDQAIIQMLHQINKSRHESLQQQGNG